MRLALAFAVLVLLAAPAVSAAAPVDRPTQQRIKSILDDIQSPELAYVPTKLPPRYGLLTFAVNATQASITFYDTRYGDAGASKHSVFYAASAFKGKLPSCAKGSKGTLRSAGVRLYSAPSVVWRCFRSANGKLVELSAFGNDVSNSALAEVVASSKRIA